MPAINTAGYLHFYFFSGTPGGQITITAIDSDDAPYRLDDESDGIDDGDLLVGAQVGFGAAGSPTFETDIYVAQLADGSPILQWGFSPPRYFLLSNDSGLLGQTLDSFATTYTMCFRAGTAISTVNYAKAVEKLKVGDLVRTADGGHVPIRWIGRQTILKQFAQERAQLVRIAAQALGNFADLYITGDHGMVVDGFVINASALVNGHSINWVPLDDTPDRQTVYHVETEAHDVILANGAASETYLDVPGRMAFDNFAEYLDLFGTEHMIQENPMPRISSRRLLPASVRAKLGIDQAA